ncbi:ionotropic receptor 21a-like [Macrobrachium rosenbergii]|uniref:ionotropic receptor 21a-like n=1 Tax=Macrobrachium rosenbergii TaxID=79674 RepID=UPI0034D43CF9
MSCHLPFAIVLLFLIIPLLEKSLQQEATYVKDISAEIIMTENLQKPEFVVHAVEDRAAGRKFFRDFVIAEKSPSSRATTLVTRTRQTAKSNSAALLQLKPEITVPAVFSEVGNTEKENVHFAENSISPRKLLSLEIKTVLPRSLGLLQYEMEDSRLERTRRETEIAVVAEPNGKEFLAPGKSSRDIQTQLEVPELKNQLDEKPSTSNISNQIPQTNTMVAKQMTENDSLPSSTSQKTMNKPMLNQLNQSNAMVVNQMPQTESMITKPANRTNELIMEQMNRTKALITNQLVQTSAKKTNSVKADRMTQIKLVIRKQIGQTDSLTRLLLRVIEKELKDCELVLCYGENNTNSEAFLGLAALAQKKQIVQLDSQWSFASMTWTSRQCRGYIFLWPDLLRIRTFLDTYLNSWDYEGKYIFAGLSLSDLEVIVSSEKGKKTEHIVGLVKSERVDSWRAYINQLYKQPKIVRVNTWMGNGFSARNGLFPDKTFDLTGVTLKACIFPWPPSVMYFTDENGKTLFPYGLDIAVIESLAGAMNFSVKYIEPPEGERWGEAKTDGSVSGMIGIVNRNEADIGVGTLFISITRADYIDFTDPFASEPSCALLPQEKPLPSWQAIAFPFQPWTWFTIMVGLPFTGLVLYLLTVANSKLGSNSGSHDSLLYSLYNVLGMHLNAQHPTQYSTTMRIYIGFLSVYCMLITIAYSTNLTAFLTVEKIPRGIETIAELPDCGMHVIGVDDYFQNILRSSPDPSLRPLADTYEIQYDANKLYSRVQSGRAIFIQNRGFMEYTLMLNFTRKGKSSLRIMKECFISHPVALGVQQHSPLKKRFNQIIGRLVNGGLIAKFFTDTLRLVKTAQEQESQQGGDQTNSQNVTEGSSGTVPLTLEHMQGLFLIAGFGLTLSLTLFAVEKLKGDSDLENRASFD